MNNPFTLPAQGFYAEATTTSGSDAVQMVGGGSQLLVKCPGTTGAHLAVGDATVEATDDSLFIAPGENRVYTIDPNATSLAVVTASGTARLYFARGDGDN